MASGHQDPAPHSGLRGAPGHHAALLRHHHAAAAEHPRWAAAAEGHEGDRVRGGGLPALLDAVPPRRHVRHVLQDKDRAVQVPGQDGGGPGHVRHPEPGPAAQLRQPCAVRLRGGEVPEEAPAAPEEDPLHQESVRDTDQQVFNLIRNHIHSHVMSPQRQFGLFRCFPTRMCEAVDNKTTF